MADENNRDFVRADLAAVTGLLAQLGEEDVIARFGLEARRDELQQTIAEMDQHADQPTASAALVFGGGPRWWMTDKTTRAGYFTLTLDSLARLLRLPVGARILAAREAYRFYTDGGIDIAVEWDGLPDSFDVPQDVDIPKMVSPVWKNEDGSLEIRLPNG